MIGDAPFGANNTIQAAKPRSVVKSKWYGDNTGAAYEEVTIGGSSCAYRRYATSHHQAAETIASLRDACRACAPPTTILRLTACKVLIALRALGLSEAMIYWLISLPILRHIALDLAGADVHDLDLDVFGGNAGSEVVADCREVVALNGGFIVVDTALLALLLFV